MKITRPLLGIERAEKRLANINATEKGRKILENAIKEQREKIEKKMMIKSIEEDGN